MSMPVSTISGILRPPWRHADISGPGYLLAATLDVVAEAGSQPDACKTKWRDLGHVGGSRRRENFRTEGLGAKLRLQAPQAPDQLSNPSLREWREAWSGATILVVVRIRKELACGQVRGIVPWQAQSLLAEGRSDESFRRHRIVFVNARVEDRYSLTVLGVVGSYVSPCTGATTATTSIAPSGTIRNYAGFPRLVTSVRTYFAWPVASSVTATAAASSAHGTYGYTYGTDVGKASRLGSIRPNADAN